MKEDLVTKETAKLAKEKKFRELCNSAYSEDLDGIVTTEINNGYLFFNGSLSDEVDGYTSAPTQALLKKWLWEKHKIFLSLSGSFYISGGPKCDGFRCYITNFNTGETDSVPKNSKLKETPEEALELGLQEALKLVKV